MNMTFTFGEAAGNRILRFCDIKNMSITAVGIGENFDVTVTMLNNEMHLLQLTKGRLDEFKDQWNRYLVEHPALGVTT